MNYTLKPDPDLPKTLLHYDVIEAIRVRDQFGLLPRRHYVVLINDNKPSERAYSTHDVAYQEGWKGQDGPWVLNAGHYDLDHYSALKDVLKRALENYGQP